MTTGVRGPGAPRWRLLVDGDHPGALNMARDVALMESVARGAEPGLRLYGWCPPCLSLGRHQGPAAADPAFCRRHGIDLVRRPTGGRAVLHHLELTYALVARLGEWLAGASARIGELVVDGIPEGAARWVGSGGLDARRLQTGLAHHSYALIVGGAVILLTVVWLGGS